MITLQVNGEKRNFTEQGLTAILEIYYNGNADKPIEGNWFEVNPLGINKVFFEIKRENEAQERTRQLILEAFEKKKKNPKKYGRKFKTMMPKKTWSSTSIIALKRIAKSLGDHNADWVEQALEWAQRIDNGETWEDICNKPDTSKYYRLVEWKNEGPPCLVGGSRYDRYCVPASYFSLKFYDSDYSLNYTVPLVVSYE